jgi:hypothetical protein
VVVPWFAIAQRLGEGQNRGGWKTVTRRDDTLEAAKKQG